ncbi:MAG: lipoate--protein ligase family protein [Gemmataceae bacterium]|nr:lipoate--protein ligase family protein [Gemmataceae bacterium]
MEAVTHETVCRLLPFQSADGYFQMAADETMLLSAARGIASFRCYVWSEATVSLGYFQPRAVLNSRLWDLPWVRRATGGKTLVHHHELTYALALPASWVGPRLHDWLTRLHANVLLPALKQLGVRAPLSLAQRPNNVEVMLCFEQWSAGDLLCAGRKIAGSAQRKHHGCLLQHGSLLLAKSAHAPDLLGVQDLAGVEIPPKEAAAAVVDLLLQATNWEIKDSPWAEGERSSIQTLRRNKYECPEWNEKR